MEFLGLRVFESPLCSNVRRYSFDPEHKVPVSDEMRASMEKWALEFFKPYDMAYVLNPNAIGLNGGKVVVMSPKSIVALRNANGKE